MKLVRTVLYLTICMSASGFVHSESGSLYTHLGKSAYHMHIDNKPATPRPQPANIATLTAPEAVSEALADDGVMPHGTRVYAGDKENDEFYIITHAESNPLTKVDIKAAAMRDEVSSDQQLERVDADKKLVSFNQKPHPDAILGQIANRTFAEKHEGTPSAPSKALTRSFKFEKATGEKNGEVADYQVALDDAFAKIENANAVDHSTVKPQQKVTHSSVKLSKVVVNKAIIKNRYATAHHTTLPAKHIKLTHQAAVKPILGHQAVVASKHIKTRPLAHSKQIVTSGKHSTIHVASHYAKKKLNAVKLAKMKKQHQSSKTTVAMHAKSTHQRVLAGAMKV